jgi:hypothetical protein
MRKSDRGTSQRLSLHFDQDRWLLARMPHPSPLRFREMFVRDSVVYELIWF